jgi:tripartite-type tricarboxylate transporter receptor subunit TctC
VLSLGALSTHLKSGAFRGLVASSRFPEFADIPTMRDLGYREELFGIWFSFLAPAGIPEDARKALVGAIEQAVKAEIREEFKRVSEMARKTGLLK